MIHGYKWDATTGKLELLHSLKFDAGTEPRHLVFSADGKWGLLQTEKTNLLMALAYDAETGQFSAPTKERTTLTIPGDWNGISSGAEVLSHLTALQRFEKTVAVAVRSFTSHVQPRLLLAGPCPPCRKTCVRIESWT